MASHKQILTQQFLKKELLPSEINVDWSLVTNHVLKHYNEKFIFDNNLVFTKYPHYYKVSYHQHLGWISRYICDRADELDNLQLIPHNEDTILVNVLKKGQYTHLTQLVDNWNLSKSFDYCALLTLTDTTKKLGKNDVNDNVVDENDDRCFLRFEYDDNRIKDCSWNARLDYKNYILYNSTLLHRITENKRDENMINLLFRYQIKR
jgi:hypothetical protein